MLFFKIMYTLIINVGSSALCLVYLKRSQMLKTLKDQLCEIALFYFGSINI